MTALHFGWPLRLFHRVPLVDQIGADRLCACSPTEWVIGAR
jgi:hypothetical protein